MYCTRVLSLSKHRLMYFSEAHILQHQFVYAAHLPTHTHTQEHRNIGDCREPTYSYEVFLYTLIPGILVYSHLLLVMYSYCYYSKLSNLLEIMTSFGNLFFMFTIKFISPMVTYFLSESHTHSLSLSFSCFQGQTTVKLVHKNHLRPEETKVSDFVVHSPQRQKAIPRPPPELPPHFPELMPERKASPSWFVLQISDDVCLNSFVPHETQKRGSAA